jgi:hypothetical protein
MDENDEEEVTASSPRPIICDKFVPKVEKTAANCPDILTYDSVALVRSVARDMLSDFLDNVMKKCLEI